MIVEVRLFANLREAAGKESLFFEFPEPPSVEAVLEKLLAEQPSLRKIMIRDGKYDERYKVLVGSEIVPPEGYGVKAGESMAILPPVSGG